MDRWGGHDGWTGGVGGQVGRQTSGTARWVNTLDGQVGGQMGTQVGGDRWLGHIGWTGRGDR